MKKINLYLDNNVWDIFYGHSLNLLEELPIEEFDLMITPQVMFEIMKIPNRNFKNYIYYSIHSRKISTDYPFSFAGDPYGDGFGDINNPLIGGGFLDIKESEYLDQYGNEILNQSKKNNKKRPTGLYKNEADVSLATRSMNNVVLTCDLNKGPLKQAEKDLNGKIVDMKEFNDTLKLKSYILNRI